MQKPCFYALYIPYVVEYIMLQGTSLSPNKSCQGKQAYDFSQMIIQIQP